MIRSGVLAALLAAGCVTETVYLRREADGRTVQCGPERGIDAVMNAEVRTRKCVEDYMSAGYERVPAPDVAAPK